MANFQWDPAGDNVFDDSYGGSVELYPGENFSLDLLPTGSLLVDSSGELHLQDVTYSSAGINVLKWRTKSTIRIVRGTLQIGVLSDGEHHNNILHFDSELIEDNWFIENNGLVRIFVDHFVADGKNRFLIGKGKSTFIVRPEISAKFDGLLFQLIEKSFLLVDFRNGFSEESDSLFEGNVNISVINDAKYEIHANNIIFKGNNSEFTRFYIGPSPRNTEIYTDNNVCDAAVVINAINVFPINFADDVPPAVKFIFRTKDNEGNPIRNTGKLVMTGIGMGMAAFFKKGGYVYLDDEKISDVGTDSRFNYILLQGTLTLKLK
ncbi:hypothetical protein ACFSE0_21260 [Ochrobactrum teleogrylli]|uniref:Uncharacterized protein n=1 Tax=Ochrobactrum teleogrylli TaxID=2479765 RepID=A0ABY2Y4X9_9HYPH|nr:hypothetical protein [[Ochrobactrum] teleogrylli]TNV13955.1 hypothetical protein FIC94_15255 [[Ochrobactrum] teleogrylli]